MYPGHEDPELSYEIDSLMDASCNVSDKIAPFGLHVHPEYKNKDEHFLKFLVKTWPEYLTMIENTLNDKGGKYLLGSQMTIADLEISAPFFRLSHNDKFENSHILETVIDKHPKVKSWIGNMKSIFKPWVDT